MTAPDRIDREEDLGRRVFTQSLARRLKAVHRMFLPKRGEVSISVDRLNVAPQSDLTALAHAASGSRDGPFCGWASIATEDACRNRRRVEASPVDGNPYHAEILLPSSAATDRGEQVRHAHELADASCWVSPST